MSFFIIKLPQEQSKKPREDKKEDKKIKPSGDTTSSQRNITSSKGDKISAPHFARDPVYLSVLK